MMRLELVVLRREARQVSEEHAGREEELARCDALLRPALGPGRCVARRRLGDGERRLGSFRGGHAGRVAPWRRARKPGRERHRVCTITVEAYPSRGASL